MPEDETDAAGPFPLYTLIFCTLSEHAISRAAAFPDAAAAAEHARRRLLRLPEVWCSVVIARGVEGDLAFAGCWDRDADGALTWEDASVA